MPFEMKVDGMEEISEQLSQLSDSAPAVAAMALYEGAGVMVEAIKKGVESIRTEKFRGKAGTRLPSPEEKEIVMNATVGIAKFNKNGTEVDTSVGYQNAGYAELGGKTVPVPVIVNAINSGTSFMPKQPFFRKAANGGAKKAMKKMQETVETEWQKLYREIYGKSK